ncbi:TATA-box binding protein associated factor 13 isoform X4 [Temnothorax americanus]|uniref:TATA-box binding protein associated factor 13 isoform X4 n=1 Tax=Temnothorax americanus TaxID=1964332 RepID=UPI0040688C85
MARSREHGARRTATDARNTKHYPCKIYLENDSRVTSAVSRREFISLSTCYLLRKYSWQRTRHGYIVQYTRLVEAPVQTKWDIRFCVRLDTEYAKGDTKSIIS